MLDIARDRAGQSCPERHRRRRVPGEHHDLGPVDHHRLLPRRWTLTIDVRLGACRRVRRTRRRTQYSSPTGADILLVSIRALVRTRPVVDHRCSQPRGDRGAACVGLVVTVARPWPTTSGNRTAQIAALAARAAKCPDASTAPFLQVIDRSAEPTIVDLTLVAHDHVEQLVVTAEDPRHRAASRHHTDRLRLALPRHDRTWHPSRPRDLRPVGVGRLRAPGHPSWRARTPSSSPGSRSAEPMAKGPPTHEPCPHLAEDRRRDRRRSARHWSGALGQARQPDNYGSANTYGDGFYGNFMFGCTGVTPVDGEYRDSDPGVPVLSAAASTTA